MSRIPWAELEMDQDLRELHEGSPFTGTAYEVGANGELRAEAEFVEGVLNGRMLTWYPSGRVESEGNFRNGVIHGERREWSEGGHLRKWLKAEHGIPLELKEWDESGLLTKHFVLTEGDPLWNIVQRSRQIGRKPSL